MPCAYILYSPKADRYYIGFSTGSALSRLTKHNSNYYKTTKFTSSVTDWVLYLEITCKSNRQARSIESHIKKMKSRTYIKNLKLYPEIVDKLKDKYT